jgi:hypothetical protein
LALSFAATSFAFASSAEVKGSKIGRTTRITVSVSHINKLNCQLDRVYRVYREFAKMRQVEAFEGSGEPRLKSQEGPIEATSEQNSAPSKSCLANASGNSKCGSRFAVPVKGNGAPCIPPLTNISVAGRSEAPQNVLERPYKRLMPPTILVPCQ